MNWTGNLQQFGRSLMIPTIALPAAAILLFLGNLPWYWIGMEPFGEILNYTGTAIFTYLPFLFSIGVALGLTQNAGIAGMAALLGYFIFFSLTKTYMGTFFELGVAGGVLLGVLAAFSYHRFKSIRLPEYIQFFGGPRFVPLFMSFASILFSTIVIQVGPTVKSVMDRFGEWILTHGEVGTFVYGVAYRLLVPFGLHHILNNVVWFQIGPYMREDGHVVYGDLPRFFAGDPDAGIFMAGLYPIMMFALPAVAFAIIHEAREDLKPKVKATFLTAALASFLTGVTEPIEFAFLFVAPYLFVVHALLSGVAMWIAYEMDIHHGFSFSAGAIDYVINEHLATNGLLLLPIGLVFAAVYYVLFRWAIRRFQLPTPGREEGSSLEEWAGDVRYRAPLILQALGGKNNVNQIEACITRLRLTLANDKQMDINALKHLGAAGVIRLGGGNVQVVFGTFSELIREEIVRVMQKEIIQVHFHAPVQGNMIPIEEVPDAIFAQKIVGNGVAFYPERGELLAPVSGKVVHVHPSMHAIGLKTEEGLEVLLHIGIDTSQLTGKWFNAAVKEGDDVAVGQLLIRFDLQKIKKHAKSLATPMVITNPNAVKSWAFAPFSHVKKGQASVMSVIMKEPGDGQDAKLSGGDPSHG
ncbi:PTS glucose transporter subunit IIA [Paenibacillus hemerocallicola]|uniref:PTS glucose transporter subunit IIA n=1 Tax=Paenibacillus hemerocallicola TaxID=1172614 RepID=A0A5C4TDJ1_9BACL|nr:glucose PTS transporter subunit IIA [Paenibacillus hemerocallicola]TNJ67153.1 PTS glucose transporter subunit IIA [Paenibacillus hemerocallicola]